MGKLQLFAAAVRPIAQDLLEALSGSGDLLVTCELHGDRMIDACEAAGIDRNLLESATPDEFIKLAVVIMEVNSDFFINRLLPQMKESVAGLVNKYKAIKQATGTKPHKR